MYEKVNPSHPDKIADRIAGAIVDLAYKKERDPKVAVEVLIGHGVCHIIAETSVGFTTEEIKGIVYRIAGKMDVDICTVKQDEHLAKNQEDKLRCGDNGIFCGAPVTTEQKELTEFAKRMYRRYGTDGKYIIDGRHIIVCQSNAENDELKMETELFTKDYTINPLGPWTGGTEVDSGATNRKLGSDMGNGVTGGGLHGKDLSKADVSVNIYAHMKAQERNEVVRMRCAIGDDQVDGVPYSEIVELARYYIKRLGGFEKFAEWGLIN